MSRNLCLRALRRRFGAVSFALLFVPLGLCSEARAQLFPAPSGGWTYTYAGGAAASLDDAALDGTWNHANDSDAWDGTGPGAGAPGGAGVFTTGGTTFLRLQDTGNPTGFGFPDPSNRKVFFTHDMGARGASAAVLDAGVTLSFRARISTGGTLDNLHPEGGAVTPWPAGGNGGTISNGGQGMLGIRQGAGGMISFDLALPSDTTETGPSGGLIMNQRNGTTVTANVNNGSGGAPNFLPLADPAQWHEFWVVITQGGAGTHRVRVWQDGDLQTQSVFDVTAGSGTNTGNLPYTTFLALGRPSTGESGAFDLDFVSYRPGAFFPGGTLAGDVNGDGFVTLNGDFEPIRANFLQPVDLREQGDLNLDGVVDFVDFGEFKAAFLAAGGSLADLNWDVVPEPTTASLVAAAGCWLAAGARRRRTC